VTNTAISQQEQVFIASKFLALVIGLFGSFHVKIIAFLSSFSIAFGCWSYSAFSDQRCYDPSWVVPVQWACACVRGEGALHAHALDSHCALAAVYHHSGCYGELKTECPVSLIGYLGTKDLCVGQCGKST